MKNGKNTAFLARLAAALLLILSLGAQLSLPAAASGQEGLTVRVGYYENEVFQEGAQDGTVKSGYAYEYYQKLSEYTGWRYDYVYGEFGDLYEMLLDGEIDFLAGLAWREDREEIIGYPDAAMGNETYNLVKHAADEEIGLVPSTLSGKKIGVLDSAMASVLQDYLDERGIQAQIVLFRDYEPLFRAFDDDEVDVMAVEGDGAYGRENAELLYAFGASDYYLCVAKSRPDLLSGLNEAQAELAANEPNYISSLRSRYYPVSISSRAFSADEKQWLSAHERLRVGYLNHYLPYSDTDASGNVTGIVRDLVPRMLDELGLKELSVSFAGYDSYDGMIAALSDGEIDTAFPVGGGLFYSEESGIFQSSPVVSAATELVYRGEYTEQTTERFAVNENNRMQYFFVLTHYPEAEVVFCPSIEDCLQAVREGAAGCTTLNGLRSYDILRDSRYSGLALLQTTYDDARCFGVRTGSAGLLRLLNRGINVLGSDYAQNLAFRYTDELYSYTLRDMIRNNAALFGGVILGIAALIILFLVRDVRRSRREIRDKEKARAELEKANAELAESQAAKQRELEERLTLQEELLEQQSRREQQDKMITALASDYRCVYHVDLDHDDGVCYRGDPGDPELSGEGIHFAYHERFAWYAEHRVAENYREGFLRFIAPEHVRSALSDNQIIAYRYLARRDGKEYYEMIRMAGVRHAEDRDDHIVHAVGLGLTDIDEEMREAMAKNRALAEALSAAEEANKAKTAFLSNMSHEIRTPMNAIIGLNNVALNDPTASDKVRETLGKIGDSAQHLLGIINDILDMSRIESGRMTIKKEEFSFTRALEQVNTIISGQCRDKGLVYECRVVGQPDERYVGDAVKLKQVMINILGNAVKFTPEGGTVRFVVEEGPRYDGQATLRFIISDTGIGMSKEFLPRIFDAFSQEDSSTTSRYGSTGLGMPITRSIVELMNGHIEVESEKGKGSVFTVSVTLGEAGARARPAGNAADGRGEEADRGSEAPEEKKAELKGRRVLLAEDVAVNAEIMMMTLGMRELQADHAVNGREAAELFLSHEPGYYDAILMDMRMPEMDGLEATRLIRASERADAKSIPIIALTANAFDEDVQRSLQAGLNAHLSKPVEPELLFETLEKLIK